MGKCDCGEETDWQEVGSTWICVACRSDEIEKAVTEMKTQLEKMKQTVRGLQRLKVNTLPVAGLLHSLTEEITKIKAE